MARKTKATGAVESEAAYVESTADDGPCNTKHGSVSGSFAQMARRLSEKNDKWTAAVTGMG